MRQRYPDEMAIILQHEFWDLAVTADAFEVSLNFSRKPERLTIPFDSITGFSDPSVPFGFKLEPRIAPESQPEAGRTPAAAAPDARRRVRGASRRCAPRRRQSRPRSRQGRGASRDRQKPKKKRPERAPTATPAKVVSIDAFRKK